MDKDKLKLLNFIELLDEFKYIKRAIVQPKDNNYNEDDAQHSWHLSMMTLLLHSYYDELDLKKCLIFSIIHDLPEIYAGDVVILDKEAEAKKKEAEAEAIKILLNKIDSRNKMKFEEYFYEYENRTSKEARFVYQLDKIQPLIMETLSGGKSWEKYNTPLEKIKEVHKKKIDNEFNFQEILDHYYKLN